MASLRGSVRGDCCHPSRLCRVPEWSVEASPHGVRARKLNHAFWWRARASLIYTTWSGHGLHGYGCDWKWFGMCFLWTGSHGGRSGRSVCLTLRPTLSRTVRTRRSSIVALQVRWTRLSVRLTCRSSLSRTVLSKCTCGGHDDPSNCFVFVFFTGPD